MWRSKSRCGRRTLAKKLLHRDNGGNSTVCLTSLEALTITSVVGPVQSISPIVILVVG